QYGNLCHTLTVAEPVSDLEIKVCGLVRTRDTNGVVGTAPQELPSAIYLRETPYTVGSGPIMDFASRFREQRKNDKIETLHEVMLGIAAAVEYRKGETHMFIPPARRLSSKGPASARTMPHLLIARLTCLRVM